MENGKIQTEKSRNTFKNFCVKTIKYFNILLTYPYKKAYRNQN